MSDTSRIIVALLLMICPLIHYELGKIIEEELLESKIKLFKLEILKKFVKKYMELDQ